MLNLFTELRANFGNLNEITENLVKLLIKLYFNLLFEIYCLKFLVIQSDQFDS